MSSWFVSCPKDHFQSKGKVQFGVPSTGVSLLACVYFQNWLEGHRVEMTQDSSIPFMCLPILLNHSIFQREESGWREKWKMKTSRPFLKGVFYLRKRGRGGRLNTQATSKGFLSPENEACHDLWEYCSSKQQARSPLICGQFAIMRSKGRPPKMV